MSKGKPDDLSPSKMAAKRIKLRKKDNGTGIISLRARLLLPDVAPLGYAFGGDGAAAAGAVFAAGGGVGVGVEDGELVGDGFNLERLSRSCRT